MTTSSFKLIAAWVGLWTYKLCWNSCNLISWQQSLTMEMNYADEGMMTSLGIMICFFSQQRQITGCQSFRNTQNPQNQCNSVLQQKCSNPSNPRNGQFCWGPLTNKYCISSSSEGLLRLFMLSSELETAVDRETNRTLSPTAR